MEESVNLELAVLYFDGKETSLTTGFAKQKGLKSTSSLIFSLVKIEPPELLYNDHISTEDQVFSLLSVQWYIFKDKPWVVEFFQQDIFVAVKDTNARTNKYAY